MLNFRFYASSNNNHHQQRQTNKIYYTAYEMKMSETKRQRKLLSGVWKTQNSQKNESKHSKMLNITLWMSRVSTKQWITTIIYLQLSMQQQFEHFPFFSTFSTLVGGNYYYKKFTRLLAYSTEKMFTFETKVDDFLLIYFDCRRAANIEGHI